MAAVSSTLAPFTTWPWQHWATKRPMMAALSYGEQSYTWQQVSEKVEDYAQGLLAQGVKRDQLIAAITPNSLEAVWLLLATVRVGARYLGLNPRFSAQELSDLLDALQPNVVWQAESVDFVASAQWQHISFEKLNQQHLVPVTWQPSRAVTFTLTSGSTGMPKAVVHTAAQHLASAQGLLEKMNYQQGDSWLLSLPLFHVSGMAVVWRWLQQGAQMAIPAGGDLEQELTKVTHASLVPTQLQRVLQAQEQNSDDISTSSSSLSLKEVLLGGAVIPTDLTSAAEAAGIACWCGYGMTEMASTVTAKRADASNGVGQVLPNREVMVKDGEIWVRGESLCLGYYQNGTIFPVIEPELSVDQLSTDAWFRTRDLGEWQQDELVILGRADNMFISGGENIQPESIEKVLLQHPQVLQAFVLPIDDAEFGQRPVAVLATKAALSAELEQELANYMAKAVTRFKCPVRYFTLPSELMARGIKISRAQVQSWLRTQ
ncbi:2-succinylbenzoate-CoA ligase [Photobacterium jeanii]|uniref:2-succinylbenzoate-CoA ligase n=1 Tax=Photobacterium jeanii TaxID=858640 RepID=A0A178K9G5_9GAMM|nr:o-succinylbenzoate--CoA ligase [Photobacterium jeanii]OAN13585.1 2-succinylbenzoate-CoA ligase [Photobacterium jeanii]PST88702.1 o-succinylbenzoate--CoA ligase [Photobacterium jeanii]